VRFALLAPAQVAQPRLWARLALAELEPPRLALPRLELLRLELLRLELLRLELPRLELEQLGPPAWQLEPAPRRRSPAAARY
jgi:hypothetical protein